MHINELFEATGTSSRTDMDDFFIARFEDLHRAVAREMPPYRKDFYQISLVCSSEASSVTIDQQQSQLREHTLYFLSPHHILSWQADSTIQGFVVYFKEEFLIFFQGSIPQTFSFFDLTQENILSLNKNQLQDLSFEFEKLESEYQRDHPYRVQILQSALLSLLYKVKALQEPKLTQQEGLSRKQELAFRFQNLVRNRFIEYKQVKQYADYLSVSATYLNEIVKKITGKTAKQLINETIIYAAKNQLIYSSNSVSEVAYRLGFEEPTHFVRFFKAQTRQTPKAYRDEQL